MTQRVYHIKVVGPNGVHAVREGKRVTVCMKELVSHGVPTADKLTCDICVLEVAEETWLHDVKTVANV